MWVGVARVAGSLALSQSIWIDYFGEAGPFFALKLTDPYPHTQCKLENSQGNPTEAELDSGEAVDRQSRPYAFDDTRPTDPGSA